MCVMPKIMNTKDLDTFLEVIDRLIYPDTKNHRKIIEKIWFKIKIYVGRWRE